MKAGIRELRDGLRLGIQLPLLTADKTMQEAAAGEGMRVEFFG